MITPLSYCACGLSIASDAPIAGLRAAPDGPAHGAYDLTVTMRGHSGFPHPPLESASIWYVSPESSASGAPALTVWSGPGGYLLHYSEGAAYLVDRLGTRVEASWADPFTDADAATYFRGPVLAFILRLRGAVPLHASAVAIDNRGVLFVGDAGAGKSTTAAVFATLGYPVLSDDIVRVDDRGGQALAHPGHPRLSVWPDSVEMLFGAPDALPVHSATYDKCYLDVLAAGYPFQDTPVPIDMIYVLGERTAEPMPSTAPMGLPAALLALASHTYCNYLLDATMRRGEFELLSRLVRQVPVKELRIGENLGQLMSSCQVLARAAHEAHTGHLHE
jgi:hypothetical protein